MKINWNTAVIACALIALTGFLIVAGVTTPSSAEARRLVKSDGSVPVVWKEMQKYLLDPQNARANEWQVKGDDSVMTVYVDFTAPNAFGGVARDIWKVTVDPTSTEVLSIYDSKGKRITPTSAKSSTKKQKHKTFACGCPTPVFIGVQHPRGYNTNE